MTGDSGNLGRNGSGNIVLNQMKNKNDSLYRQDFAEVYIAESVPTKQERSLSEPIQNRMADTELMLDYCYSILQNGKLISIWK